VNDMRPTPFGELNVLLSELTRAFVARAQERLTTQG